MKLASSVVALCLVVSLSGCSNEVDADPGARVLKSLSQLAAARIKNGKAGAPQPSDQDIRAALKAGGKPILKLQVVGREGASFLAPFAVNQGVTTWASNEWLTLSSRDGVLLATRGFGPDIMAATVPSAAQIAQGGGTHTRRHVYLDGGDQTQAFTFTCTVSTVGPEQITVLGQSHATRHVVESCSGDLGSITNHYWLEGGKVRQSTQSLAPGALALTLQAVID